MATSAGLRRGAEAKAKRARSSEAAKSARRRGPGWTDEQSIFLLEQVRAKPALWSTDEASQYTEITELYNEHFKMSRQPKDLLNRIRVLQSSWRKSEGRRPARPARCIPSPLFSDMNIFLTPLLFRRP